MSRAPVICAAVVLCTIGAAYAMSSGGPGGRWPKSWPKELEPLRQQAWTWVGMGLIADVTMYDIPFTNRDQFEAAWPQILKVKGKGVPLTLVRAPYLYVEPNTAPGVRIIVAGNVHTWPGDDAGLPPDPAPDVETPAGKVSPGTVTGMALVVDGDIVDLNRILLPADTPILDKRFDVPKTAPGKPAPN
jgi:hypothetical protein